MITPVIMAGGSGSRLWPLSRKLMPKQFLKISSDNTMIQETVLRLAGLNVTAPLCICNEEHRFVVAEQLRAIDALGSIILEPEGRNTAPAIALAALSELSKGNDPIMLVLAADHVIENQTEFRRVVQNSVNLAEHGKLVTFGIVPTHAETGYGYIRAGARIEDSSQDKKHEILNQVQDDGVGVQDDVSVQSEQLNAFAVDAFVEKPDLATAQQYLDSGEYYWNSGMFMFKASRYVEELAKYNPDILNACKLSVGNTSVDLDFIRVDADEFAKCPDDSIDYAVMEPLCQVEGSDSVVVVPLDANWNDIGSFSAIWDINDKDEQGNVHQGDVVSQGSTNNLVIAEQKLVATVGIKDCIVVETKDAVLVAHKDKVQDVKKIVEQIKADDRCEANLHRQVYRPWGNYDSIDFGKRDQVKRITVKPGEKLSIQMHHHRSEHWIVVSGTAKVTNGEDTFLVRENESTYIPIGQIHALENPGILPLELIEVQVGDYLGEDDIVRFEDRYGRTSK
ncbi:mannose-1-phosphate guanylyltransferase/mannose-6-phosphate isomerase [Thalassomonas sp. M1454]|uniref:mannose-1-phosphate guanylyltransferase/mannose-6-phosphate isomerase n=1 Tax=Thalassomonas sp. M1454 TaxID=2594477 RepID=UPI00117FFA9F|nr:mannose-1-phosphate guanylyltransferase/mannose-6-phosphate isomerase [Thalassomonas sp. M1454]TRX57161.1 mannose-1-phosphate guanylyltransferase/mannose-6-phosphate isomerase [Thalassomonas sp. M1454]